jgi:hypothetical protein
MFIIHWVFDKLGYMPKIKIDTGVVAAWPFPAVSEDFDPRPKKKPVAKKATTVAKKATKKPVKKA